MNPPLARALDVEADLAAIAAIDAVPTILEVVCRAIGMGFAAVARVTEDRWIACGVRDEIAFGLKAAGELKVETTICSEVRQAGTATIIDHVTLDPAFCDHPTPALYGLESYVSVPITLPDGTFLGTLSAIDPRPHRVNTPEIVVMFRMFAQLIGFHIDAHDRLAASAKVQVLENGVRLGQDIEPRQDRSPSCPDPEIRMMKTGDVVRLRSGSPLAGLLGTASTAHGRVDATSQDDGDDGLRLAADFAASDATEGVYTSALPAEEVEVAS